MNSLLPVFTIIDPVLIAPYRWVSNPLLGWWIGTAVLALICAIAGELTSMVAMRINRRQVEQNSEKTLYYHHQSIKAKKHGDEEAYKDINRLANDAFGKSFFLLMAMGMASLWPAFFGAAWLQERFGHIRFYLPEWIGGFDLNFLAPFIILYITARLFLSKGIRRKD